MASGASQTYRHGSGWICSRIWQHWMCVLFCTVWTKWAISVLVPVPSIPLDPVPVKGQLFMFLVHRLHMFWVTSSRVCMGACLVGSIHTCVWRRGGGVIALCYEDHPFFTWSNQEMCDKKLLSVLCGVKNISGDMLWWTGTGAQSGCTDFGTVQHTAEHNRRNPSTGWIILAWCRVQIVLEKGTSSILVMEKLGNY